MNDQMNIFVTESNVELFLSKAYKCLDPEARDTLLRLVVDEEGRMGRRREHVENGRRRLHECRDRAQRQRNRVAAWPDQDRGRADEQFLLETLEKTLLLMEEHQRILGELYLQAKL